MLFGEALIVNDDLWRHHHAELGADLVERFTFAQAISPAELGDARAHREPWRIELAEVLGAVGVLALPTMAPVPGPPRPSRRWRRTRRRRPSACRATRRCRCRCRRAGCCPASLQLVAPDHHEPRLLATAAAIEAAVAAG